MEIPIAFASEVSRYRTYMSTEINWYSSFEISLSWRQTAMYYTAEPGLFSPCSNNGTAIHHSGTEVLSYNRWKAPQCCFYTALYLDTPLNIRQSFIKLKQKLAVWRKETYGFRQNSSLHQMSRALWKAQTLAAAPTATHVTSCTAGAVIGLLTQRTRPCVPVRPAHLVRGVQVGDHELVVQTFFFHNHLRETRTKGCGRCFALLMTWTERGVYRSTVPNAKVKNARSLSSSTPQKVPMQHSQLLLAGTGRAARVWRILYTSLKKTVTTLRHTLYTPWVGRTPAYSGNRAVDY
jgi:hypothetical protein